MSALTHVDGAGRARMVDVSDKPATTREAVAEGRVTLAPATLRMAVEGSGRKGEVLRTAELAGVMAAKRTAELIPLCHPLALSKVVVEVEPRDAALHVTARVQPTGPTGVEREALTAVSVACLTLYDMLKAADKAMTIEGVRLVSKTGGASGDFIREAQA